MGEYQEGRFESQTLGLSLAKLRQYRFAEAAKFQVQ